MRTEFERSGRSQQVIWDYATTVVAVALVTVLRFLLDPILKDTHPYLLFIFPALFLAGRAGWVHGALALIVGGIVANFCFAAPRQSLWVSAPENQLGFCIYFGVGAAGVFLAAAHRAAHDRAERAAAANLESQLALRKQQARLLDHAFDPILTWEIGGSITFWNLGAERLYGYSAAEAIGRVSHDLLQTQFPPLPSSLETILQRDKLWEGEVRHRTKHGIWVTVDCRMAVVAHSDSTIEVIEANHDVTARRAAEVAVHDTLERLRGVVDQAVEGIITIDLHGMIESVNPAVTRIFGYTSAEVIGQNVAMLMPEPFRSEHDGYLHAYLRTGQAKVIGIGREVRGLRKDGTEFPLELSVSEVQVASGRLFTGIVRDISLRKQAEATALAATQQAEQALARMRAVFAAAADGLVLADGQGNLLEWNPAALALHGFESSDGILRPVTDFAKTFAISVPGAEPLPLEQWPLPRVLRGEHLAELELHVRRIDIGREWYISYSGTPIRGSNGEIEYAVLTLRDVTARRRAEEGLRASEERLRLFLDAVPAPIAMLDRNLRYLYHSRRWLHDYQLSDHDLTGRHHFEIFPEVPERWRQVLAQCLAGEVARSDEDRFERADGSTQWLRWEVRPWHNAGGEVGGIIIFSEMITDRKRAEQAVRDRERLLGIVTGSARVGLVVVSEQYQYLFANQAYADIFALDASHIVGRRVPDLLAAGWDQIRPRLDRALAGEQISYELLLPTPTPRWYRVMYEPRADEDERPTVVVVVAEITELKRTEEQIRESEDRYRRLMDVLPDAVFVHSGGQVVFCNPALLRMVGATSADELIGRSPFELAHPDFHDQLRTRLAGMSEPGLPAAGIEIRIVRRDGRSVPAYSVTTMLTDKPQPAYVVALSDLTERERSVERLGAVMRSVLDAIVTIDERGTIQSVNSSTERIFGYSTIDLVGRSINILMPEPHRGRHDSYIAQYLRTGKARVVGSTLEVEAVRRDGSSFPAEVTVTEFRLDGVRHFTGVIRDLTDRRKLENQFRQAQKMEAVGQLAGGVAHDFNNLLTVINGYSEMLLAQMNAGDPTRAAIAAVLNAGERAAGLTMQLLAFSRQAVLEPKVLEVNAIVAETAKMLTRLIGEDICLGTHLDARAGRIKVDPGQFGQVLMNLAVNARDAMPTGGQLTIETKAIALDESYTASHSDVRAGKYVLIAVTDTGHGMSDAVKSRIFEPFFTTKEAGKGTGLGLATVYGIVKQSGGHVDVYSEIGVGTTFKVYLPAVSQAESAVAGTTPQRIRTGSETILLVEDQKDVRMLALAALRSYGYTVLEAADGEQAVELVDRTRPTLDLLLTDVVMPGMGGSKLAQALSTRYPGLKVLYMSGYMDDAVVRHGLLQAEVAFLRKPYTPRTLAQKVRDVLDQP